MNGLFELIRKKSSLRINRSTKCYRQKVSSEFTSFCVYHVLILSSTLRENTSRYLISAASEGFDQPSHPHKLFRTSSCESQAFYIANIGGSYFTALLIVLSISSLAKKPEFCFFWWFSAWLMRIGFLMPTFKSFGIDLCLNLLGLFYQMVLILSCFALIFIQQMRKIWTINCAEKLS